MKDKIKDTITEAITITQEACFRYHEIPMEERLVPIRPATSFQVLESWLRKMQLIRYNH